MEFQALNRYPGMMSHEQVRAHNELVEILDRDNDITAAIVSGSILRGEGDRNSDFDVIAITSVPYKQRKQFTVRGVFVELFLYSEDNLIDSFNSGDYQDMHMVAYGRVAFNKGVDTDNLQALAKSMFEDGPKSLSLIEITERKYFIWDMYQDVLDIVDQDFVGAYSLMNKCLWDILDLFFQLNGQWFCKPKKMLKTVNEIDPVMHNLLQGFYYWSATEHKKELLHAFKQIMKYIIYPHLVSTHLHWESANSI